MKNGLYGLLFLLSILVVGCATQKVLQATGGSKSDGTVELSYQVGLFEEPVVDFEQGLRTAKERCAAWDYSNAEPFGGSTSECQAYNGYGDCVSEIVTFIYQCTGNK